MSDYFRDKTIVAALTIVILAIAMIVVLLLVSR
jgi:hypothetical protein